MVVFCVLSYIFYTNYSSHKFKSFAPKAKAGYLDIRDYNLEEYGILKLDGEWEFYWNEFLTEENFNSPKPGFTRRFEKVPSIWNHYKLNNARLPENGYATYRLTIHVKDPDKIYGLKIPDLATSYTLYINGEEIARNGKAGKSNEEYIPGYEPKQVAFEPQSNEISIILHISNYLHHKGGLWNYLEFGTGDQIRNSSDSLNRFEFFMLGVLSIMCFYHFGLFLLRRKDPSTFYFGLLCLVISFRIMLTGERYLFLFADTKALWIFLLKLEFITVYLATPAFVFFLKAIYPEDMNVFVAKFVTYASIPFVVLTFLIDTHYFSKFISAYQYILLFLVIYTIYLQIEVNIKKREGAAWIATGLIIFLLSVINDLLYVNEIIFTGFIFPFGLFVFVFSQSFIISMRFSKAFNTIESMSERLMNLDRLKDDFLANTSHELRTPLNGIIGIAESLLDGATGELQADTKMNLNMIVSSGKRLGSLVNDILDFSRLKNREIELQSKQIDLFQVSEMVLRLSEPLLGNKDLKLINYIPPIFPEFEADENRLLQILHNLIGNAIKFTEKGEITISAGIKDSLVEICVSDTGIGIPEEKQELIFQSFEQMDSSTSREYGGTGLGLSITKQLVELHGGQIRVQSVKGEGSKFYFTIPYKIAPRTEPQIKSIQTLPKNIVVHNLHTEQTGLTIHNNSSIHSLNISPGNKKKILAIDDEPINLQVLINQLGNAGYNVITALNGQEGLNLIETEKPDLVLLDLMMPRMSGYEVCKKLRENFKIHELPIIMISAKNQLNDVILGLDAGANDYIYKPFQKQELLSRIDSQLSVRKAIETSSKLNNMERELETAKKIQANILPAKLPKTQSIRIETVYLPMQSVGGDLYDFHIIDDTKLGILIADVSGHGISAAIIMGMVKLSFKQQLSFAHEPEKLLENMNKFLYGSIGKGFVTACYCYIDTSKMEISFSSAGHPAIILIDKTTNEFQEFAPKGTLLGAFPNIKCQSITRKIQSDFRLLMITDGVLEMRNKSNTKEMFGDEKLKEFIHENASIDPKIFMNALVENITEFSKKDPITGSLDDDITIVLVDIVE